MTTTTQAKDPIVNGNFNHSLTNEEMLNFGYDTKKNIAWNLIVSMQYGHSFRNIDPSVFKEGERLYTYEMLTADGIDNILVTLRTEFQQRHKNLLALTRSLYYQQGQKIYAAQRELGFSGFLQMDSRKLVGYLHKKGSWNNFNAIDVCRSIDQLEQLAPKMDYGPNNPNTGSIMHEWFTFNDYLTLKFNYVALNDMERVMEFYKRWQAIGQAMQADSIRHEITENRIRPEAPISSYTVEFVYWWD